ncbi:MAG: PASTA domain-containing protein [Bacteroidales bacterium]|jgi:beta-lactam-binding protein with PASTA domain|nr:PASTA domain-containing protein [Bacteroidales bacterium]MDY0284565.1 PASTA domain-containing protein [Bacteroidales bacterium]HPE85809.1 PASTA domain-containing protein [Bacteroidales bacterium]
MGFGRYLLSKKFIINFGLAMGITLLIVMGVLKAINIFTRHGQAFAVPDYSGIPVDSLSAYDPGHNFRYIIIDSIYQTGAERGTIILQNPAPGALVKEGRKIYFTIVALLPEKVPMPNLLDLSLRQAITRLKTNGLKPGTLNYVTSFDRNAVLGQLLHGDTIPPDSLILKGSTIDLVLGTGYDHKEKLIPFLIGKKPYEAREMVLINGFNQGKEYFLDTEKQSDVLVYKQDPDWAEGATEKPGSKINLYYRAAANFDFDSLIRVYFSDTLVQDSISNVFLR